MSKIYGKHIFITSKRLLLYYPIQGVYLMMSKYKIERSISLKNKQEEINVKLRVTFESPATFIQ